MEDDQIIALYFNRIPQAIEETAHKYGAYCQSISYNILGNKSDAEECVNDTYFTVWNRIPPTKPSCFSVFLGKIVRNISISRWRSLHAMKRGKGQITVAIEELDYCLSSGFDVEKAYLNIELNEIPNEFLGELRDTERRVFLCRYWYFDSVSDIADQFGFSVSKVKSMLLRTRNKLKRHLLEKGGFEV